jgi:hypothetical protein
MVEYNVCFDTHYKTDVFEYLKFNRATLRRDNTRARFDSAPLVCVEKACSSIKKEGPPLSSVGAAYTTHPGLLLT